MNPLTRVFISYQRTDEAFARQVREHLLSHGAPVWMDQYDISVGAYWPDAIDAALGSSDTVVGILSPDAVGSRNVKNEWDWALQNGKALVLLQVAPCLVPHRYVSINFIDATGPDPALALAALSRALGIADMTTEPAPTRHAHRVPHPASRVPTFIAGREREQATLRAQLDRLLQGHGSLVLIGGEAGIGKTTLTTWLAAEAESHGAVVLTGGCYDLTTTPPYGPWGEIVRGWPDDVRFPPVPDELRGGEAMARLQSQPALFELATDLLATAGTVKPLVLLLEDLHWADQASLDLLRYLSRLVAGFRIMLVCTYRDDELTRRHPLYQLLPSLAREAGAERVSLQRLGEDATRELIASRYDLPQTEHERLAAHVHHVTEGNPLFAAEVLRELEERAALRRNGDSWQLAGLDAGRSRAPELVRQVIEGRLLRLGEEAQRLLGVAAMIGHDVPLDLWVAVSGADEGSLSDTLEKATEAHIVEELPRGDGFRFTHALIRETLYEGLGLLRRRSLHRAVGEALAASSRPDPDAVAHHLGQASDDRAFDWLIQAGDRAQRSYAWLIAAERYEQAAALIADDTERQREYGWLHVLIARMLRLSDTPRALGFVTDGARIGRDVGDCWLWLFGSMHVGYFQVLIGETRLGVQRLVEVGAEMEVAFRDGRLEGWTPPERLTLDTRSPRAIHRMARQHPNQPVVLARALECVHLAWSGRLREAESLGGRLTSVWSSNRIDEAVRDDALGLVSSWGDLYLALARVSDALGHPDESLERLDIATRAYAMIPHYVQMAGTWSMKMETLIAYRTEDISARRLAAEQAIANASKAVGASMEFQMAAFHRGLSLLEGHWHQARDLLSERHARVHDGPRWFGSQRESGVLAQLHRQMGSIDDAWRVINAFLPDGAATEPGDSQFYPALTLIHTAASLALDAKDAATGRAWLESHDRWLSWSGAVLGQVAGHLGWARCYRETGDLAAAEQHARTALSKASDPRQPLGLIAAHRLLGELASQRGAHAVAHEHLRESLSLAERCEAPYEIALTQTALAELCVAVGEGDTARDLLAAARATCERLGAAPHLTRIVTLEATIA